MHQFKKIFGKVLAVVLSISLSAGLTGCFGSDETGGTDVDNSALSGMIDDNSGSVGGSSGAETGGEAGGSVKPEGTWAVYIYCCGADLESNHSDEFWGEGSDMMDIFWQGKKPDNLTFVIETGGASSWSDDFIDSDKLDRIVISNEAGMEKVDALPQANMGDPSTLSDFINFCLEEYPADNTMLCFWNHGGGTVGGVCYDENFDGDSLELDELYEAILNSCGDKKTFDVVGMDACLMASVDVANVFSGCADYMLASEEISYSWDYTSMVNCFYKNPNISPVELCRSICDSYKGYSNGADFDSYSYDPENPEEGPQRYKMITMSVLDLEKVDNVISACDDFAEEAIGKIYDDNSFFTEYQRAVRNTETFSKDGSGISDANMIDLGDLAQNTENMLTCSVNLQKAVDDMVIYKIDGGGHPNAHGLSCYVAYSEDTLDTYIRVGAGTSFKYFYSLGLTGTVDEDGMAYLEANNHDTANLPSAPNLKDFDLSNIPIRLNSDSYPYIKVGPEVSTLLTDVRYSIGIEVDDDIYFIGSDNEMDFDYSNGEFTSYFSGNWGSFDGVLCYMDLYYSDDECVSYLIPALVNGYDVDIEATYYYEDEEWVCDSFYYNNELYDNAWDYLEYGDEISLWAYSLNNEQMEEIYSFIYTEDTPFEYCMLPDSDYVLDFELYDARGNMEYSDYIFLNIEGNDVYYYEP